MDYKHIKTVATGWSICNYYEIPENKRFTATWSYGGGWLDKIPKTEVKQTAKYVVVVKRRSDLSFFDFQVLDEDFVTIRGKHCKDISKYLEIYNDMR